MKIRKTTIKDNDVNIFIYENKKDEYFVVAIPTFEWSTTYTYDDMGETLIQKLKSSLQLKLDEENSITMAHRILQWTREM